ncbi:hypothetical protein ACJX0J_006240 [Zea mays]
MAIDRGRCGKEIHESRSIVSEYQMLPHMKERHHYTNQNDFLQTIHSTLDVKIISIRNVVVLGPTILSPNCESLFLVLDILLLTFGEPKQRGDALGVGGFLETLDILIVFDLLDFLEGHIVHSNNIHLANLWRLSVWHGDFISKA